MVARHSRPCVAAPKVTLPPHKQRRRAAPKLTPQLGQVMAWCMCSFTIGLVGLYSLVAALSPSSLPDNRRPWVIAHRGASGTLPEHTREAYLLAIQQEAAFIECDVALTSDCGLICRHEPLLSGTTNADEVFPNKMMSYDIDDRQWQGVFAIDLTLAEVKMLHAKQSMAYRDQDHNGLYSVPTLQEYIDIALSANRTHPVGIYPEVKHPSWHDSRALSCMANTTITEKVMQVLHENGYTHPMGSPGWLRQPAFIQSFEVGNLQWLATRTQLPLIQLLDPAEKIVPDTQQTYGSLMSEQGLASISQYAAGIGPHKRDILGAAHPGMPGWRLIDRAHAHGLAVHPFTFRDDPVNVDKQWKGDPLLEARHFMDLGVDGAFTDFPATWHKAVMQYEASPAAFRTARIVRRERPLEDLQEM